MRPDIQVKIRIFFGVFPLRSAAVTAPAQEFLSLKWATMLTGSSAVGFGGVGHYGAVAQRRLICIWGLGFLGLGFLA